jgi:hypothetical protein
VREGVVDFPPAGLSVPFPDAVGALGASKAAPAWVTASGSDVHCILGAISGEGCAALRQAVDAERSLARDSVDRHAEHQRNLSTAELEELVGPECAAMLYRLPGALRQRQRHEMPHWEEAEPSSRSGGVDESFTRVELFVRR